MKTTTMSHSFAGNNDLSRLFIFYCKIPIRPHLHSFSLSGIRLPGVLDRSAAAAREGMSKSESNAAIRVGDEQEEK
jgi:hypothetical protein